MLVKFSSIKFHENPSGGRDGHYVADSHFSLFLFANASKIETRSECYG